MSAGMHTRNLCVKIAGKEILHGLNVDIKAGRRTAIIGPNGAGKTTLLRALAGLNRRYTGEIMLDGRALNSFSEKELARVRAILPQERAAARRCRCKYKHNPSPTRPRRGKKRHRNCVGVSHKFLYSI